MLVDGQWVDRPPAVDMKGGFKRPVTSCRNWVTSGGSGRFEVAANRYHLYVSYACPWAHRTLITRALHGLEDVVSVSVVDLLAGADGWVFSENPGAIPDFVNKKPLLRDIYTLADPNFTGRVTVPVLWDRELSVIVNNESREIVRMFNTVFEPHATRDIDLWPSDRRDDIERVLDAIYEPINNGVYKCGFASNQAAYEAAFNELFEQLDHWDKVLSKQRYLCGDKFTEADIFLFTTLLRFDPVYHTHFKCNRNRLIDFPNLWGFTREIYQMAGVTKTVNMAHIKGHYFKSHTSINPRQLVPLGPTINFDEPHDRDRF